MRDASAPFAGDAVFLGGVVPVLAKGAPGLLEVSEATAELLVELVQLGGELAGSLCLIVEVDMEPGGLGADLNAPDTVFPCIFGETLLEDVDLRGGRLGVVDDVVGVLDPNNAFATEGRHRISFGYGVFLGQWSSFDPNGVIFEFWVRERIHVLGVPITDSRARRTNYGFIG